MLTDAQMHQRQTEAEYRCPMAIEAETFSLAFLAILGAGRTQVRSILFVFGMPYTRFRNAIRIKHGDMQIQSSITSRFLTYEVENSAKICGGRQGSKMEAGGRDVSDLCPAAALQLDVAKFPNERHKKAMKKSKTDQDNVRLLISNNTQLSLVVLPHFERSKEGDAMISSTASFNSFMRHPSPLLTSLSICPVINATLMKYIIR